MLYMQSCFKRIPFLLIFIIFIISFNVKAEKLSLENDGSKRSNVNDCYGKSTQIPPSYKDLEYYDCYIPYQETPETIGGWWHSDIQDYGLVAPAQMKDGASAAYIRDLPVGNHPNKQSDNCLTWSSGKADREDGMSVLRADNGLSYYEWAMPEYCNKNEYNYVKKVGGTGPYFHFGAGSDKNWGFRGQLMDVVLTSGDVIHFVPGDANASEHSNGPCRIEMGLGKDASNSAKVKLKLENYAHVFNGSAGNILELWGSDPTSGFSKKFGLSDKSDIHIAFIRMYNAHVWDKVTLSDEAKNASDKTFFHVDVEGGTNRPSSGNPDEDKAAILASNPNNTIDDKFIPENELYGLGSLRTVADNQTELTLPSRSDFTDRELRIIAEYQDSIHHSFMETLTFWVRVIIAWIGLLMILYAILLLIAYYFDMSNNFFNISLVGVLTLGRIKYTDYTDSGVYKSNTTLKRIVVSVIVLIVVAGCLITGAVYLGVNSWLREIQFLN